MKQSTQLLLSLFSSVALMTGCGESAEPIPTQAQKNKIDSLSKVIAPTLTEIFGELKMLESAGMYDSNMLKTLASQEAFLNKKNPDIRLEFIIDWDTRKGIKASIEMDEKYFQIYSRKYNPSN